MTDTINFTREQVATKIAGIRNNVVRDAAGQALSDAGNDQTKMSILGTLIGLDAKANGTAIFYSGIYTDGVSNGVYARDLQLREPASSYRLYDTPAGQYLQGLGVVGAFSADVPQLLGVGGFELSLWQYASAKMADQAVGAVSVCNQGTVDPGSTWNVFELAAMRENYRNGTNANLVNGLNPLVWSNVDDIRANSLTGANAGFCYPREQEQPEPSAVNAWETGLKIAAVAAGIGLLGVSIFQPEFGPVLGPLGLRLLALGVGAAAAAAPASGAALGTAEAEQASNLAGEVSYLILASGVAAGELPPTVLDGLPVQTIQLSNTRSLIATAGPEGLSATIPGFLGSVSLSLKADQASSGPTNDIVELKQVDEGGVETANEFKFNEVVQAYEVTSKSITLATGTTVTRTRNTAVAETAPDAWRTTVTKPGGNEIDGSNIGLALGSSLGQALGGNNPFARIAAGTVLGALTANVGAAFGRSLDEDIDLETAFEETAGTFNTTLANAFKSQVTGAASSFLTGELMGALGVGTSFGGQLLRSVTGSVTNTVLSNAINIAQGADPGTLFNGLAGNVGSGISSFLGAYIAHLIVQPENIGGSIGGTVLGSVGGAIGAAPRLPPQPVSCRKYRLRQTYPDGLRSQVRLRYGSLGRATEQPSSGAGTHPPGVSASMSRRGGPRHEARGRQVHPVGNGRDAVPRLPPRNRARPAPAEARARRHRADRRR